MSCSFDVPRNVSIFSPRKKSVVTSAWERVPAVIKADFLRDVRNHAEKLLFVGILKFSSAFE